MLIVRQITNFCRILVKSSLEDERKETALETQCFFAKYDLLPILIRFNALFSWGILWEIRTHNGKNVESASAAGKQQKR